MTTRDTFESLRHASAEELSKKLANGASVDLAQFAGYEYRGLNCHVPGTFGRYARQFTKVFVVDDNTGRYHGWNLKIQQDPDLRHWRPDASSQHRPGDWSDPIATAFWWLGGLRGRDPVLGRFGVYPAGPDDRYAPNPKAIVIDYCKGPTPLGDVTYFLRDYVVALREGDPDLLVGCAFADFGLFARQLPGYFVLEKAGPIHRTGAARMHPVTRG